MATAKEQITQLVQQQPDDSSYDEIIRELAFHAMIERGLKDVDDGRTAALEMSIPQTASHLGRDSDEYVTLDLKINIHF